MNPLVSLVLIFAGLLLVSLALSWFTSKFFRSIRPAEELRDAEAADFDVEG